MTPEEITAMAKEASICHSADSYEFTHDGMLGFAALVAAKEREACLEVAEMEAGLSAHRIAQRIRARGAKEGV